MMRCGNVGAERIVVFRALRLGDMLCAVPALRVLRRNFPEAMIDLIGLPETASFAYQYSAYVDRLRTFPGFPGLPERPVDIGDLPRFVEEMQRESYDLALQLHGNGVLTNSIVSLFGAKQTAGFYQPGSYCPDPKFFLIYPEGEHEIRRCLELMRFLGFDLDSENIHLPLASEDYQAADELLREFGLTRGWYVCIHPGASVEERRWSAEHFAAVARTLIGCGENVLLTGTAAERALCEVINEGAQHRAYDLSGRTGLGCLAALLQGAKLLVCNDTAVSHIATALDVPSVVVFSSSDPQRWAPLDRRRHAVIKAGDQQGASDVIAAALSLLRTEVRHVG